VRKTVDEADTTALTSLVELPKPSLVEPERYFYYLEPTSKDDYLQQLGERSEQRYTTLAMYLGKPGKGKSMAGLKTCERMDPTFSDDKIVFSGKQFKQAVKEEGAAWILWDEPNKGLSHRKWYTEINQVVTVYLQTSRFREKNVIFALPHDKWIDKNARGVMAYELIFWNRGIATAYLREPNYFGGSPEVFKKTVQEVEFRLPSHDLIQAYEDKREAWHQKEFPDEPFDETVPEPEDVPGGRRGKPWRLVLQEVQQDPMRYYDKEKDRITARLISSLCECSDQTARKVMDAYYAERARRENTKTLPVGSL